MNKPIVFIHIPKTAGTSFWKAAENYYGIEKICKDYGSHSLETSQIVHDWTLDVKDPWRFKKDFIKKNYLFLTGHVQAKSYVQIFGVEQTCTFVRDPIQRIASEFQHHLRHNNYNRSFEEFSSSAQFINKQSKMLHGVAWPAIRFIGIADNYDISLDLFNLQFGTKLKKLEENIGKTNMDARHQLRPQEIERVCELNSTDIQFYEQACRQFEWRVKLYDQGRIFTRGMIGGYSNRQLKGWAVYDEGDDPVQVEVLVNGKSVGIATACEARPQLQALGLRRGGFVGFTLEIPKLETGNEVTAVVVDTEQPLANSPWVYSDS